MVFYEALCADPVAELWKQQITSADADAVRRYVEPFDLPFYQSSEDWLLTNSEESQSRTRAALRDL